MNDNYLSRPSVLGGARALQVQPPAPLVANGGGWRSQQSAPVQDCNLQSVDRQQQQQQEQDEMLAEERDLADDAPWKRIQQNTFTRWVNEHLKQANRCINSLKVDLSDGLMLIALIEVLSGKRMPRHNKRTAFRSQKLENVSVALKFLEKDEHIKIVNIDSSNIVDCQLKLILGLVWTLILHYSISMPMWDGETGDADKDTTPKQRLMNWIKAKMPDIPVKNFTSDWNDGKAIGALVDGVAPGLCPDWSDWKPEDALKNASEAMGLADDWLNVPQLIQPADMVDPNVDDLSMMTYLSQYPNAKLKPSAPLRPRTNPNRVRCYGPGVEPSGVVVGAPTFFTVETFSAGQGRVECELVMPDGSCHTIEPVFNHDRNLTYTCTYTPIMEGAHQLIVKFVGKELPKSPYHVQVEGFAGDPSLVTASGPGLQASGTVVVAQPTYFDIFTKEAGKGSPEVSISGASDPPSLKLKEVKSGHWRCDYVAQCVGQHAVSVLFATKHIPNSPFPVKVGQACDVRRVRAVGRGLQSQGVRCSDKIADFRVLTEGAGDGPLKIRCIGPGGTDVPVEMKQTATSLFECQYNPAKEGRYVVMVTYAGQEIAKSPFEVNVGPHKESRIRCYGSGLQSGVAHIPAVFSVDTNGETGALGFRVEGPSEAVISCHDNGDGSATVSYMPTTAGTYCVHVLCDGEDVPGSPWLAEVLPPSAVAENFRPDKVTLSGAGVDKEALVVDEMAQFTIDASKAGSAPLDVSVIDANYQTLPVRVAETADGVYTAQYTPVSIDKHVVQVNYGGVAAAQSPYRVTACRPDAVRVFGAGVTDGVSALTPTSFTVDARHAGTGQLAVSLVADKEDEDDRGDLTSHQSTRGHTTTAVNGDTREGAVVPVNLADNGDGTWTAECTYPRPGSYKLTATLAGHHVPATPLHVHAAAAVDVQRVRVHGLQPKIYLNSPVDVVVDTSHLPQDASSPQITAVLTDPDGKRFAVKPTHTDPTQQQISYTPTKQGEHSLSILCNGEPLANSPYQAECVSGCDPARVTASGEGLTRPQINRSNQFNINTRGAGVGGIKLSVEGPSECGITCDDNGDGTCHVQYVPTEPGQYDVIVKFADQHISGSPFKVCVEGVVDPSRVLVSGAGVQEDQCRAGVPQTFLVDTRQSAPAPLAVSVTSDTGELAEKPCVVDNGDGTHTVTYHPPATGRICMPQVLYDGQHVPGSPWRLPVRATCEPELVVLDGPGVSDKGVPASLPTSFIVDATRAGFADLEAQILGPDGCARQLDVVERGDGTYTAHYTPDDCGPYRLSVQYGGQHVPRSPLNVHAFPVGRADDCRIDSESLAEKTVMIGEQQCVQVNASHAGQGRVTCRVRSTTSDSTASSVDLDDASNIDINIEDDGSGTFRVLFTVRVPGDYTLNIKFGGEPVPEGFYTFSAKDADNDFRPVELENIPLPTTGGMVTAAVTMPDGDVDQPTILDNRDGTVRVVYAPRLPGLHQLDVLYNNEHVQGSPFRFHVEPISSSVVTAHGPGLVHAIAGQPANFNICTKNAGAGGLSLAVEGPSKADISCHDNGDGTLAVSYLPTAPGQYKVAAKFADAHIVGSPFTVKVTGEGRQRSHVSVGSQSDVPLLSEPSGGHLSDEDLRALTAELISPSALREPCFLKRLPNNHLGISFTPREVGEHLVHVQRHGTPLTGSPFSIDVGVREVADASKVHVHGAALHSAITHRDNQIVVDTREAGYGGLSMSVEGPSKAEIKCDDREDGKLYVSYHPTQPGVYLLNLKFGDSHVRGSPFTVQASGEGGGVVTEQLQCRRDEVTPTAVGAPCAFSFKMPGVSASELTTSVTSPDGHVTPAEVSMSPEDSLYTVHFVPAKLGVHSVAVMYADNHIPGSPFPFTVGPLQETGAVRVHAGGPGLERGRQAVANSFDVWTREAGAGTLALSVEGPSRAVIDVDDRRDGSCHVSYLVPLPGEYKIGIRFNDQHIPDSPYKVYVSPHNTSADKVTVAKLQDSPTQVNKPLTFTVDAGDACVSGGACDNSGAGLECRVVAPDCRVDDCFVSQLDNDRYAVRFVPRQAGVHHVHATWHGAHVTGSPFRVHVAAAADDDASGTEVPRGTVHAHGAGLSRGVAGVQAAFVVDTCSAAAGTLAVTVDGPAKVVMECVEVDEGYRVLYMPPLAGNYVVGVKYNDQHITGSPFTAQVSESDGGVPVESVSAPVARRQQTSSMMLMETGQHSSSESTTTAAVLDQRHSSALATKQAALVRVQDEQAMLQHARVGQENSFLVDASNTDGGEILWVACVNARARSCHEVRVVHVRDLIYHVFYTCKQPGRHVVMVHWGHAPVPGSPFHVHVQ